MYIRVILELPVFKFSVGRVIAKPSKDRAQSAYFNCFVFIFVKNVKNFSNLFKLFRGEVIEL